MPLSPLETGKVQSLEVVTNDSSLAKANAVAHVDAPRKRLPLRRRGKMPLLPQLSIPPSSSFTHMIPTTPKKVRHVKPPP